MAAAPTPQLSTWDLIKGLATLPSEAQSAAAGLAAKQAAVSQVAGPQAPMAPAVQPPSQQQIYPQDLLNPQQGPYGSRLGEQRLDSQGNVMTGLTGIKRNTSKGTK